MTSPITHEKIIEVLRDVTTAGNHAASQLVKRLGPDFVEDYFPATTSPETALSQMGDIVSYDFWVIWSAAMKARDLYQRLQAEKEGGWQPTHWIAAAGAKFERVTQAWCPDIPGEMVVFRNRDGRHFVRPLDAFNSLYTPLNQEGGDAAEPVSTRPGVHVAPPASANAGTGRATDEHPLKRAMAIVVGAIGEPTGLITLNMHAHLQRAIAEALASEHQRGLAEGERIEREVVASWMIAQGFATGHGDTTSDLLSELADGIADRVSRSERIGIEKAAKVAPRRPCSRLGGEGDMRRSPLAGRPSLRTSRSHPLVRELGDLARRNGVMGAVLITFTGAPDYRVGVNTCGDPDAFGKEMEHLGDRILAAIDDGQFDPEGSPSK